jgi:hypothetical protein
MQSFETVEDRSPGGDGEVVHRDAKVRVRPTGIVARVDSHWSQGIDLIRRTFPARAPAERGPLAERIERQMRRLGADLDRSSVRSAGVVT